MLERLRNEPKTVRWFPVLGKLAEASVSLRAIYQDSLYMTELWRIERAFGTICNLSFSRVGSQHLDSRKIEQYCPCSFIPKYLVLLTP